MSQQLCSPSVQPAHAAHGPLEDQLTMLTRINTDDLLHAFGFSATKREQRLVRALAYLPARRFARQVAAYDARVGTDGLQTASSWLLQQFVPHLDVRGAEHLRHAGPLLIVANHPGLWDTLMLFATISRPDLRVIAADRPFLRALPQVEQHLLYVKEAAAERLGLIRSVTRHLRARGAVLTFPGGTIEPDPAAMVGASAALDTWSESIALFARLADNLAIVPAIVSGVQSARALSHPLTRLRRSQKDREWLGATLQIVFPRLRNATARLAFGAPVVVQRGHAEEASEVALATARRLIDQVAINSKA